jgi:type I restriction enzyme, S subunit
MWRELPLGNLAAINSGGTPATDRAEFWGGDIPWVTPTDITACRTNYLFDTASRITKIGLHSCSAKLLPVGSILFTSRATVGVSRIAGIPVCTNQGFKTLTAAPDTDGKFLFYQVQRLRGAFERYAAGSTFPEINKRDTARVLIPHPADIRVQRKITAILSTIDTAIEQTEALIEKYQHIKAGLMHDLFTRGVLPNGQLRPPREQTPELYQETAIGWIPREWKLSRLETILRDSGGHLQTGPFGSQLHAHEYQSEGVPVVMPQDINDGRIGTESIARISEKRALSLAKHQLKVGDIIIARRGELSRAAAVTEIEQGWLCGTGCFLLRIGRTELNHFFFSHIYRYDYIQRQIAGTQVGTTMPSLNNSVMGRVFFPCPTPKEQTEISARLSKSERELDGLKEHAEKLKLQKLGLMQDLLTGKVPVTVDVLATELAT